MGFSDAASLTFKILGDNSGIKKTLTDASQFVQQFVKNAEKGANFSAFKTGFDSISTSAKKTATDVSGSLGNLEKTTDKLRDSNGRFASSFKPIGDEAEKAANKSQSAFKSAFSGGFFGSLAGTIVSNFTSVLYQIPSKISEVLDEAVKIAQQRENALKGLESIATFKGINPTEAQSAVQSFRLVKAGIVDVGEATTALKNLLATGFSLPQAIKLYEAFSDSAAFGKQSALGFGEAIRGASEGLKNGNSILIDNAGITKNLSVILEENGKSKKDVMNITSDASVRQVVFNGLLKEAQANTGDADKLTKGYTGSVAGLDQAYKNLYASGGKLITQSPEMISANRILAKQVQGITGDLNKQGSETAKTAAEWIKFYAEVKVASISFAAFVKNLFLGVTTGVAGFALGIVGSVTFVIEGVVNGIKTAIGTISNYLVDVAGKLVNLIPAGISDKIDYLQANLEQLKGGLKIDAAFDLPVTKGIFDQASKFLKDSSDYGQKMLKAVDETNASWKELKKQSDELRKNEADRLRNQTIKPKYFDNKGKQIDSGGDASGGDAKTDKKKSGKISDAGFEGFATNRQTAVYQAALRDLSPELRAQIVKTAEQYGIPASLALAQIFSESSFNAKAKSPFNANVGQNAFGLTQFLPSTASAVLGKKTTGKDLFNSETALTAYGKYMTKLFEEFGDWELAVFAYHNGEGAARAFAKALDSGNKKQIKSFAEGNPKGIAYTKKISSLSGVSGKEQFQYANDDEAQKKVAKIDDEATKRREQSQAKSLLSSIKSLDEEVSLRESANKVILADQETLLKNGEINEQGFARIRALLDDDLLQKKKKNKESELALVKEYNRKELEDFDKQAAKELERAKPEDKAALKAKLADERLALAKENSQEETAVKIELQKLDDDIAVQAKKNQQEISDATKKSVAERKEAELSLLQIRRDVAIAEQNLATFRAEQRRKVLVNEIEFLSGAAKREAIENLRQDDLKQNEQRRKDLIDNLNGEEKSEKEAAKKRISNKEDEEKQKLEITKKYKLLRDGVNAEAGDKKLDINEGARTETKTSYDGSPIGEIGKQIQQGLAGADASKEKLALYAPVADTVTQSFSKMAQAAGSAVRAFVLFGSAGGGFRKFAAEMIASIAQMATVQAVWETAQGLAMLALAYFGIHPTAAVSATEHFASAAVYAGIAGIAAGVGRSVAGNSFSDQTASGGATGKNSGNIQTTQGRGGSGNGGTAFSSNTTDDKRIESNRNSPQRIELVFTHKVESNNSHILQTVQTAIADRHPIHGQIVSLAEG